MFAYLHQAGGVGGEKAAVINYRPNESFFVSAGKDRITVIFSTQFTDDDDIILGKIFLQVTLLLRLDPLC
jgi:actin related protein 2/3 complex subunit 2